MKKNIAFFIAILTLINSYYRAQVLYTDFNEELDIYNTVFVSEPGECSGEIDIQSENGETPFLYSIDGGKSFDSSNRFSNLCPGKYFIHVRDNKGKLGLSLAVITSREENIDYSIDTVLIINEFNEASDPESKRIAQLKLSSLGIKYDVEIVQIAESMYEIPMLNIPRNSSLFCDRIKIESEFEGQVRIVGNNLILEIENYSNDSFNRIVDRLGYSGYKIINN